MLHRFDVEEIFGLIQEHRVTAFSVVPTMATALINHEAVGRYDFSSLRMVNIGGAPSNPRLIREMMEVFGCECCAGYGLTETSPVLTIAKLKNQRNQKISKFDPFKKTGLAAKQITRKTQKT